MRGAHFGLCVAVLVCGTESGCGDSATTCACCCVDSLALLILASAAGSRVGHFVARITGAHDMSGGETVLATGGITKAADGCAAAVFDVAAWLADVVAGNQCRSASG